MRIVIALGGNALQRRGEAADLAHQRRNLHAEARAVADLAKDHQVVVTHGNGPQVGWLAMQTGSGGESEPAYPLDVLDADALLLTNVDVVYLGWGTLLAAPIHRATPKELDSLDFARGSMAPKVEAACRFDREGRRLEDASAFLVGMEGALVRARPA